MNLSFSELMLTLFGVSLFLVALSLLLLRGSAADSTNSFAKFFLIVLRVAIGWHCFIEGMEKINTPGWSSEGYLREASGPLAEHFREAAGDRLLERVDVGQSDTFPALLEREWQARVRAFSDYYQLTADQKARGDSILEKQKKDTLAMLVTGKENVAKISAFPPEVKVDWTMKQRLKEHERFEQSVRAIEAKFPTSDKAVLTAWKSAKADLAKWRNEIKRTLTAETDKLKKSLSDLLSAEQKERGSMPESETLPMSDWRWLDWSDFGVKWALLILGALLMVGLFSRISSLATALLILSFYLAMPPLPGWPESPRLEGHYLLINKTLIEVIALFALTFIPTGRWAGVDALLCACFGKKTAPKATG